VERQRLVDAVTAACQSPAAAVVIAAQPTAGRRLPDLLEVTGAPSRAGLPASAHRRDGTPVDVPHGGERYTTRRILDAELDLNGPGFPGGLVGYATSGMVAHGLSLPLLTPVVMGLDQPSR